MWSETEQLLLLNAIVAAATSAAREAAASAGLDERALSHAMLIAGNVMCLLAQSELEAVGIDEDEMDTTVEEAVEAGVAYTLQLELHSPRH